MRPLVVAATEEAKTCPVTTLPDGSQRSFSSPFRTRCRRRYRPRPAKAALAGVVDGKEVDTSYVVDRDASWRLSPTATRRAWKSSVIPRPTCQPWPPRTCSPASRSPYRAGDRGRFSTMISPPSTAFTRKTSKDRGAMQELVAEDIGKAHRQSRTRPSNRFCSIGEHYKGADHRGSPRGGEISLYKQGDWGDLCRGPMCPVPANRCLQSSPR